MDLKIRDLLSSIGLTAKYVGYWQMKIALEIAVQEPNSLGMVTKWLYPETAKRCGTNWKAEHPDCDPLHMEDLPEHSGADGWIFLGHRTETGAISCNTGPRDRRRVLTHCEPYCPNSQGETTTVRGLLCAAHCKKS